MRRVVSELAPKAIEPAPRARDELDPAAEAEEARRAVLFALRAGRPARDGDFDRFLPLSLRLVSGQFWTPLVVAQRAAAWIDEHEIGTVVDIGSGAGKFCVAAAIASRASFVGIEQRGRLVAAAERLSTRFEVASRVAFSVAEFGATPPPPADAYYVFNPFGENLFGRAEHLDGDVDLSRDRFVQDVSALEALLAATPVGTFLLTYNGFGGGIPATFQEIRVARDLPNVLRLWRKTRASSGGVAHSADAR